MTQELNDTNFDEIISQIKTPIVIDFYANWCGPCKVIAPDFERLSNDFEGKVSFIKVDIDKSMNTGTRFLIRNIPAVVLVTNGEEASRIIGVNSYEKMKSFIENGIKQIEHE